MIDGFYFVDVVVGGSVEVDVVVDVVWVVFLVWVVFGFEGRVLILCRFAQLINDNFNDIVTVEFVDNGLFLFGLRYVVILWVAYNISFFAEHVLMFGEMIELV